MVGAIGRGRRTGQRRPLIIANPSNNPNSDEDEAPQAGKQPSQSHSQLQAQAHTNGSPSHYAQALPKQQIYQHQHSHSRSRQLQLRPVNAGRVPKEQSSPSSSVGGSSMRSGSASASGYTPSPVPHYDSVPHANDSSSLSGSTPPPDTPQYTNLAVRTSPDDYSPDPPTMPTLAPAHTTKSSPRSPMAFSPEQDKIFIMATTQDAFVHVDITGARSPEFIRERMFSQLLINDHEQHRYAIYRTEIDEMPSKTTPPLSGDELLTLCLAEGDRRGTLKFIVLPSMRHPLPPIDTRTSSSEASGFSPLVRQNAHSRHRPNNSITSPMDRELEQGYIASESEVDPPQRGPRARGPSNPNQHASSPSRHDKYLSPVKSRNGAPHLPGRAASPSPGSAHPSQQQRWGSPATTPPLEIGHYDKMAQPPTPQRMQSNERRHKYRNLPLPPAPQAAPPKPEGRPAMRPAVSSPPNRGVNMGWFVSAVAAPSHHNSPISPRPPSPGRKNSLGTANVKAARSVENLNRATGPAWNTDRLVAGGGPEGGPMSTSVPPPPVPPLSADPRTSGFSASVPITRPVGPLSPHRNNDFFGMFDRDATINLATTLRLEPPLERGDPVMPPPSPSYTDESTLRADQAQQLHSEMIRTYGSATGAPEPKLPKAEAEDDGYDDSTLIIYGKPVPPPPAVAPMGMPQPQHFFPASVAPPLQHPPVSITIDSKPFSPVKEDDGYDTDSPVLKFAKPPPKPRPESRFIKRESVTWNVRPPAQEVYENLEEFFPDHDLDKPLLDPSGAATASASSSALAGMGDSPQTPLSAAVQSPLGGRPVRHRKTIRHVATERKKILDRTSKIAAEETPEAAMVRKRSTKLWNTKIEEVSSRAGIPSTIPESPATTGAKPITRWIKGDLIGKGTYGKVFLALNANTGEMIAVKQVELPKTASDQADARQRIVVDAIKSESAVLRDLEHPNVVQYLGFEETMDHFNLFLEYVPGGSIGGVLRKMGQFDEDVTKNFTKQILNGLDYLHSRGVWHRDLKGDNILVDTHGVCKISDFGISKRNADFESFDKGATNMMGSIFWMAPEVMAKSDLGYNGKVDIWSVGCVYVEMITGRRPWDDENFVSVMFKVSTMREAPPLPNVDEFGRDFCELCFERDPTRRPTAAALRAHQYLNLPSNWSFVDFVNRLH